MFAQIVRLRARSGLDGELLDALRQNAEMTRHEPGSVRFEVYRDAADPSVFFLFEHFESEAALEEHRMQPHYDACMRRFPELLEDPAERWVLDPAVVN